MLPKYPDKPKFLDPDETKIPGSGTITLKIYPGFVAAAVPPED